MQTKNIEDIKQYRIIKKKDMPDLNSKGYLLQHIKSGARVFIVSNDDRNKVFYVAFRTPPLDSTGTPHILEHTVLCGSEKYRAKDPFIELAKGSLNTFLNAMTYPDKTVFPVASTNDKDFANLSDVYMDAVLHPAIYKNEKIFRQEGWHYELESEKDELKYNGVVYNEMKGAYSSPDDVLDRYILASLYPDTAYALESGGDPEEIPDLTYEKFLEMHKKYYHPSNSYIYLYGDADMAERLVWLDKEYLSNYKAEKINSAVERQDPFTKTVDFEKTYGLSDAESTMHNTYLSYNCVIKDNLDPKLYVAFSVLQYALLDSPGAPLKQALLDAKIGQDIDSTYDNGLLQPFFAVIAKYADASDKDKFLNVIRKTLTDLVKNGLNKKTLLAALNVFEFRYREADFGTAPKGLIYGLQALDSWLYKDSDPFMHIEQNATFAYLKKEAESDSRYFEDLIEKYLIDNPHSSVVVLKPEKGLTAKKEKAVAQRLKKYRSTLSKDEIADIVRETKELKAYQEEPSTEEQLLTIPLLEISDIEKKARSYKNDIRNISGTKLIYHDIKTNGIAYLGLMLSTQSVPERLVPYLGLLRSVLGNVNTKNYTYEELNSEINLRTGGMTYVTAAYPDMNSDCDFDPEFEVRGKVFEDRIPDFFELAEEVLFTSDFSDEKRLREIIRMIKSRMQSSLVASGNVVAVERSLSYITDLHYYKEKISGIDFYRFIDDIEKNFSDRIGEVRKNLQETLDILLHRDNLMTDMTGTKEAAECVGPLVKAFKEKLSGTGSKPADFEFNKVKKNEGFRTASQVQYVAKAGNYKQCGLTYRGELKVLRVIMGYDYLWNNIRVLGGAYGCGATFLRNGDAYMSTYRDPHLKNSIKVFEEAVDYIKKFDVSDRDMTKFVIGTISDVDTPLTPVMEGMRSLAAYMSRISFEDSQRERDEVLSCTQSKIRELAPYIEAIMKADTLSVVGAEAKLDANKDIFGKVDNLL
ncbi:MAG: insulinase family protein [Lachnospiraceae bacterium]|nr:insulinase family protein [Lachnospiraceae bacterium]